jgi:hypothetical protein
MIFNYMPWSRKGGSQKRSITQSRYGNRPTTAGFERINALNKSSSKIDEDSVKRFNEESQSNLLSRKKLQRANGDSQSVASARTTISRGALQKIQ